MAIVRSITVNATLNTQQFDAGARRLQTSLRDVGNGALSIQGKITGLGASLLRAGAGAAAAVLSIQGIQRGLQGMIEVGERSLALDRAFTAIAGSAEAGRKELNFVADAANRLGVSTSSLSETYRDLIASTRGTSLEGEKTRQLFEAVTLASRNLGLGTEQVSGALRALSQIASTGTVQMDELRGELGNHLPGALAIAARAMNVSTGELVKLVSSGKLASEDFLPRFADQLRKELGQTAENATTTASQGFAKMGNAIASMLSGPGQKLSTWIGGLVGGLADVVTEGDKARRKLEEVGESRAKQDITRATQGRGAAETAENKLLQEKLATIEGMIAAEEKELELHKARLQVGISLEERRDLLASYETHQKALSGLQAARAQLLKQVRPAEFAPEAENGFEGTPALMRHNEEVAARTKKMVEGLKAIAEEAKKVEQAMTPWETAIEKAEAERKVWQTGLEKIQKEFAGEQFTGDAANLLANAFAREAQLREIVKTGKEAAEQDKQLKREMKQEEQDYDQTVRQVSKEKWEKIQQKIAALREESAQVRMTAEQYQLYELAQLGAGKASLETAQGLQKQIKFWQDYKDMAELMKQADKDLEDTLKRQVEAREREQEARWRDVEQLGHQVERQIQAQKRETERLGGTVLDLFDGMVDALSRGGDAWEQFGRRVFDTIMRIVAEKSGLEQILGEWLMKGVNALGGLFGSAPSATSGLSAAGAAAVANPSNFTATLAEGGPVTAGRPYWVGEMGPEPFIPATNGYVMSRSDAMQAMQNGQGGGSTFVLHVHGVRDPQGFMESRSQIQRALTRMVDGGRRSV